MLNRRSKITKVQLFGERSAHIKSIFTNTIKELNQINEEIEHEVETTQFRIDHLQDTKNNLQLIKSENETMRTKLSNFFN